MVDGVSIQGNQLQGPGQLEDPFNLTLYLSWGMESGEGIVRHPRRQWREGMLLENSQHIPPTLTGWEGESRWAAHPGWSVCWSAR